MAASRATSDEIARPQTWIALLGRRDMPTDGVEDYCTFLGQALAQCGVELKQVHVLWMQNGWFRSLLQLSRECGEWRERWVLFQYTALAWSRRGFGLGALAALAILRHRGVRCAVVFHEPGRHQTGSSWIGWIRGACQDWVVRRLYRESSKAIFPDPLESITWLPHGATKTVFIPIGGNIPERLERRTSADHGNEAAKTVAVFCLSDPPNVHREIDDISHAARFFTKDGSTLRVIFVGRGTEEAREEIEHVFRGIRSEVVNVGLQCADQVSRILVECDVLLCVRGMLFPRRGSAIAGITCGLPIVAYGGGLNLFPISEAGLILVPYLDRDALAGAVERILKDRKLWQHMHDRSVAAQRNHFSWNHIASTFVESLQGFPPSDRGLGDHQ
jgi:glycosyltransferase involved in cell wall biosynthesis